MRVVKVSVLVIALLLAVGVALSSQEPRLRDTLSVTPPPIASDTSIVYDYPIVYVRAPRNQTTGRSVWAEVGQPRHMSANSPLMILYPDGTEEVLVPVTTAEAIADPMVSNDGQWVFYAKMHNPARPLGSDIYKVHIATKAITRLTFQEYTPNTGVGVVPVPEWKVFNLGPTQLGDGRIAFVSDRNNYEAVNPNNATKARALQLFTMDEDGGNPLLIGELNLGMALHPVTLRDGRIMFASLESQGLRSAFLWGLWSINPDGTEWGPLFSAFGPDNGVLAESAHFQTQLSDGRICAEMYYNLNNMGFGPLVCFAEKVPDPFSPEGPQRGFGPAKRELNPALRFGRHPDGKPEYHRFPFSPYGFTSTTPFVNKHDSSSGPSDLTDPTSQRVGKFTHPSGAPDNHMLVVWSVGGVYDPTSGPFDAGIYLMKNGGPISQPGDMRLIKNDPRYNEQWPRAVVPYKRIYGVDAPAVIPPHPNKGTLHSALPEGTPFGLFGTSSLYKRETFPNGEVLPGSVTATFTGIDPSGHQGTMNAFNYVVQGADAGIYKNSDIHAIRIIQLEPTTMKSNDRGSAKDFSNNGNEKMRIIGEFPVRHFNADGTQPVDPDGNPDTSFLVKIPANVSWKFQMLDKLGMALTDSQTWHQLKPGEVRTNCGGCHAHSQAPTEFKETKAAKAGYDVFDLTQRVPLMTSRSNDQTGKQWDAQNATGIKFVNSSSVTVEYHRDIKPILARSCAPCHTSKNGATPAALLDLDNDTLVRGGVATANSFAITAPNTYMRLAADIEGRWGGYKPMSRYFYRSVGMRTSASRYIRMFQARRSLLIWKLYGQRLDGLNQDDIPHQRIPGDETSWSWKGVPITPTNEQRDRSIVPYTGEVMPPPTAVASGLVQPLSDEDKLTFVRWIELGSPIDLTAGGWTLDDQRPTLAVTLPTTGVNEALPRMLIGAHDLGSGLNMASLSVVADVALDGVRAGTNAASKFKPKTPGVWEWRFAAPLPPLAKVALTVSVADVQGNQTTVARTFATTRRVTPPPPPPPPPPPAFTRRGCFADDPASSDLRYRPIFNDPTLTLPKAVAAARAAGFRYFGLMDEDTVRADYELKRGPLTRRPDSECNVPLTGEPEVLSGVGTVRFSLYEFTGWTMPPNPLPPPVPVDPCPLCPVYPTAIPQATFIGFEDVQGPLRSRIPDGKPDYHFRLTGLQKRPIAFIDVKAGDDVTGFKWSNVAGEESPQFPEGKWWLITYTPTPLSTVSDTRDIWFANPFPDKPYTSFRIYVVYDEHRIEDRDFATATASLR